MVGLYRVFKVEAADGGYGVVVSEAATMEVVLMMVLS